MKDIKYTLGYRPEPPDERDLFVPIPEYDLPRKVDWTEQVTGVKDQKIKRSKEGCEVTTSKICICEEVLIIK